MGPGRTELEIHLDGKKVKPRDSFVHQVGAICEDGNSNTEIRRRMTAGANAWRKVEGVTGDRRVSRKLEGKVLTSCVTPAYTYGLETMALTENQEEKWQVCEKQLDKKNRESEESG